MAEVGRSERLFFALWPDAAAQQRLHAAGRDALKDMATGKAVPAAKLHLTLAYLGVIAPAQRQCVEQAANALAWRPFELVLDHLGWFSRPRVLWAGCSASETALTALAADLAAGVRKCGVPLEARPFRPHVTLARKITEAPRDSQIEPIHCPIDALHLVASISETVGSRPAGVRYETVATWQAQKSPAGS